MASSWPSKEPSPPTAVQTLQTVKNATDLYYPNNALCIDCKSYLIGTLSMS